MIADDVMELIEGATIVSSFIEDEKGFRLVLSNGQVLIIIGDFSVGLLCQDNRKLH